MASEEPQMSKDQVRRYGRQMTLPEFGASGQRKLNESSILVIGAGGLGSPVLLYLAGSGIGTVGIADGDVVEEGNLHRQIIHDMERRGVNKAISAKTAILKINPSANVVVYPFKINSTNAFGIISKYDVVIDATDSVAARYILSDVCVLTKKPLVSGAALRGDGQLSVYNHNHGPCYRCINPIPPDPETVQKADTAGVLGPTVGIIGCMQATEAIKIITGIGSTLSGRMLLLSGLAGTTRVIKLRGKQANCVCCGENPLVSIQQLQFDYEKFCGISPPMPTIEEDKATGIACEDFAKEVLWNGQTHTIQLPTHLILIDVRSKSEYSFSLISGTSFNVPYIELKDRIEEIKAKAMNKKVVFVCRRGNISQKSAVLLKNAGHVSSFHLIGGLLQWHSNVDHSFSIY